MASHSKWTMHTQAKSIIKIRLFKIWAAICCGVMTTRVAICSRGVCSHCQSPVLYVIPRCLGLDKQVFQLHATWLWTIITIRVGRYLWIWIAMCCSIEQRAIRCLRCQHEARQNNSTTVCNWCFQSPSYIDIKIRKTFGDNYFCASLYVYVWCVLVEMLR